MKKLNSYKGETLADFQDGTLGLGKVFSLTAMFVLAAFLSVFAANPYKLPNNTWLSISGKVTEANPNSFQLNYGDGKVLVEMDDWDWYAESHGILKGEVFEAKSIVTIMEDQGKNKKS